MRLRVSVRGSVRACLCEAERGEQGDPVGAGDEAEADSGVEVDVERAGLIWPSECGKISCRDEREDAVEGEPLSHGRMPLHSDNICFFPSVHTVKDEGSLCFDSDDEPLYCLKQLVSEAAASNVYYHKLCGGECVTSSHLGGPRFVSV